MKELIASPRTILTYFYRKLKIYLDFIKVLILLIKRKLENLERNLAHRQRENMQPP